MNNRPIKFRIWDRELGIFENFADSKTGYLEEILIHPKGFLVVKNTIALTILDENRYVAQQFTGLKDSTGKEIYEGDIVERHGETKVVKFLFGDDYDFQGFDLEQVFGKWEIIGNIFETPELLT